MNRQLLALIFTVSKWIGSNSALNSSISDLWQKLEEKEGGIQKERIRKEGRQEFGRELGRKEIIVKASCKVLLDLRCRREKGNDSHSMICFC